MRMEDTMQTWHMCSDYVMAVMTEVKTVSCSNDNSDDAVVMMVGQHVSEVVAG